MKIIINCEPENVEAALVLASEQIAEIKRYDKPGWGWHFRMGAVEAFVRGIKGGISITERKR